METVKKIFNSVPIPVWVVVFMFVMVIGYWKIDDIGAWWEGKQQDKADAKIEMTQKQIDEYTDQITAERALRKAAEARELVKAGEAQELRDVIAKRGGAVETELKRIDEVNKTLADDNTQIEAVSRGDVSLYEFCIHDCDKSAKIGYPCRPTKCDFARGKQ